MRNGINVNEELIFELTSRYAKEFGCIPETNKQAIQYAFEQGVKLFTEWYYAHEDCKGFTYTVDKGAEDAFRTCFSAEGISREFLNSLNEQLALS